jgi:hypothetical protein
MKIWRISVLLVGLWSISAAFAADPQSSFDAQLNRVIARLNHEAETDPAGPSLLSEVLQREYGTGVADMKWGTEHSIKWGEIATLAYIRATTGRTFETMVKDDARRDFGGYAEKAGMNPEKMAHSLESLLKLAEKERNSHIFERLRASRTIQALPDLGSGFGMYQEGLDFRRLDAPELLKIHTVAPVNVREDQ